MIRKILEFIVGTIAAVIFSVGGAVFLIEWMAGCGETYIDAKGVRHPHECVFINLK